MQLFLNLRTYHIHTRSYRQFHFILHTSQQPKAQVLPIAVIHPEKRGKRRRGNLHKIWKSQTSGLQSNNFWKSTKIQPLIDRGGYYGVPKIIPSFRIHCVNKNLANPITVGILLTNLFGIFLEILFHSPNSNILNFNQLHCLAD